MKKPTHFQYKTIQRIKSQEFERFFAQSGQAYAPYLNHLGEIRWMIPEEAAEQHEFFHFQETALQQLRKKLQSRRYPEWKNLSPSERELRLQFRAYLEKTYSGEIRPETARMIPARWMKELSREEIEAIPVTLEIYQSMGWNKPLLLGAFAGIILTAALLYYLFSGREVQTGSIIIESNLPGASVFLNNDKKGYADFMRIIPGVPAGAHRVSLKKSGYIAKPEFYDLEIAADSAVTVYFRFEPLSVLNQGYLKITADYGDSRIYINDEPYGALSEKPLLPLAQGDYNVTVDKAGFEAIPPQKYVSISPGDTAVIAFQQVPLSSRRTFRAETRPGAQTGALEITANTSGGRIFLNDQDTGKETDYVFSEIPLGRYAIKVQREGYQTIPPEHVLTLTSSQPRAEIAFELVKRFEKVSIRTNPAKGDILIDGKLRGSGSFEGMLETGEHELTFGNVPGYKTPQKRTIAVQPNLPLNLQVDYFPQVRMVAEISDDGNMRSDKCEVKTGYTLSNRGFTSSEEAGPEIVYLEALKSYYWKFGFAFPFRNPKGNDALKVSFNLPRESAYGQKFTLKFYAAASRDRYPLSLSSKVDIKVKLNGTILSYYFKPKFFDEVNGMEEVEWDISSYVKPGPNSLEITVTDDNNTFILVKRVVIAN